MSASASPGPGQPGWRTPTATALRWRLGAALLAGLALATPAAQRDPESVGSREQLLSGLRVTLAGKVASRAVEASADRSKASEDVPHNLGSTLGCQQQGAKLSDADVESGTPAVAGPQAGAGAVAAPVPAHPEGSPWRWEGVQRIVAVGDIHGAFAQLTSLLREVGVIDAANDWSAGTTHLVALGDLEDRGAEGRRVIDLLMKLQQQAKGAGGAVHVVLGNHEVMNVVGDTRYVSVEDFAAFASEENRDERAAALRRFKERAGDRGVSGRDATRQFETRYPPGYFGRRAAFSSHGVYGRWIISLPVAVVLNGTAFVHGGAGSELARAAEAAARDGRDPLDALAESARAELMAFLDAEQKLEAGGVIYPEHSFAEGLGLAAALVSAAEPGSTVRKPPELPPATPEAPRPTGSGRSEGPLQPPPADESVSGRRLRPARRDPRLVEAARRYVATRESLLFRSEGPLWYRAGPDDAVEGPRLDAVLAALKAHRLVVGHTPTTERRVAVRLGGRFLGIDTGMLTEVYEGQPAALVLAGERATVHYAGGVTAEILRPSTETAGSPAPQAAAAGAVDATGTPARPTAPADAGGVRPEVDAAGSGSTPFPAWTDAQIEAFLSTAEVVKKEPIGTGITHPWRLTLRRDGIERRAAFKTVREEVLGMVRTGSGVQMSHADKFAFEIAAYRLDRMIGLDMVPVTVERTIDGEAGSVMDWVEKSVPEMRRKADGIEPADENILERQRERMRLFDVLICNIDRNATNLLVTPTDWKLHLIDHSRSFRTDSRPPENLRNALLPVADDLRPALAALDLERLKARLGDLLSHEQLKAVLKRRDWLLDQAAPKTN